MNRKFLSWSKTEPPDAFTRDFVKTKVKLGESTSLTSEFRAMADSTTDDIADPSPLEEDLTCPICRSIFTNPVLLSCTHSFCKGCLDQSWKGKSRKDCPVCRHNCDGEQPIINRALKAACESFQKEKGCRVPGAAKMVCGIHNREFHLFCEKDETPVCVECLNLHFGHNLIPLDQGIPICKVRPHWKMF